MVTAAIYARKSTEQKANAEDKSVTRQVENARAFAKSKGWTVRDEHVYSDDGISGAAALTKLVSKARMLDVIRTGPPFQVLVMQSNDRLSRRDGDESFGELKQIAKAGVQVWFYADGQRFQYGDFASNTLGFLKGEFAAEFRRAIATKTREAMARKAQHGYVTGGRTYGYDNVRVNSHTERRVNEAEAATVRKIYELYAGGNGLATIAHTLNEAGAPCPRAQQSRVTGWCPASVREILKRCLYRGEIIWGKAGKRDDDGQVRGVKRPAAEWLRVPAPALRIVSEELADAVDARFASQKNRALRTRDGRLIGKPPGEGSPYLLTGLLTCALCGGGMEVVSSKSGGHRTFSYRCYVRRRKGEACCTNALAAPMLETDAAVLASIESTLLDPRVVKKALDHAERAIARDLRAGDVGQLQAELDECAQAIRRLTSAIASGGDLPTLVAALQTQERHRTELQARLETARTPMPELNTEVVRAQLASYVADWKGLLRGHVYQAQQILRRLVRGRLTMKPAKGTASNRDYYTFTGVGTVQPLLGGTIRLLASPSGKSDLYKPLRGRMRRAA